MAGDDAEDGSTTPDPWDEIVADSLDADGDGMSFDFEEAVVGPEPTDEPDLPRPDEVPGEAADEFGQLPADPVAATDPSREVAEVDEQALVEDWLSDDGESEPPTLSVYPDSPAEEPASDASTMGIGTGTSGLGLHAAPDDEEFGADAFAATPPDGEPEAMGWPGVESSDDEAAGAALVGFPEVAGGAAAAVAAATTPSGRPTRSAKRKSGGLGQLVGVVLGGLMAIPITLAILIYGLGKDPFGVTKQLPEEVAFLLPEKFRPGFRKPSPAMAAVPDAAPTLDDLPAVTDPVEPMEPEQTVEPEGVVTDEAPAAAEPGHAPEADLAAAMPAEPAPESEPVPEPVPEPTSEPQPDEMPVDVPSLDALAADGPPAMPAEPPAEPPPLDTAALDEAVGEASALSAALGVVDDRENRGYRLLRTRWYRALARMAEELVAVEHAAVTSGRPLAAAPESVVELHGTIGASESLAAELAALAPDWLAYAKRGSDGVVLPATFESVRRVGPLWAARVSLTDADGMPIDLTVMSRNEPVATAGERVVVTGVAVDDAVVWAADIRGSGTGRVDADGDASDGFEPPSGF